MKTKKVDEFLTLARKRPRTRFAVVGKGTTWTFHEGADLGKATAGEGEQLIRGTCVRAQGPMKLLAVGGTPELMLLKSKVFAAPLKVDPKAFVFKSVEAEDDAVLEGLQAELEGTLVEQVAALPAATRDALLPLLHEAQAQAAEGNAAAAGAKVQELKRKLGEGKAGSGAAAAAPAKGGWVAAKPQKTSSDAFKQRLGVVTPQFHEVLKKSPPNRARLEQAMKDVVAAAKSALFDAGMEKLDALLAELKASLGFLQLKTEKDPARQAELCVAFLQAHGAEAKVWAEVEDIHAEARKAWGVAEAKKAYAAQMKGDASSPHNPGNVHAPKQMSGQKGRVLDPAAVAALAKQYGLDEAEVMAIRAYTAADYKYINPAVANQEDHPERQKPGGDGEPVTWMDAQHRPDPSKAKNDAQRQRLEKDLAEYEKSKKKRLRDEGSLHAGMLMEAFKKLPKKAGTLFRGARMNAQRFASDYAVGKEIPVEAFLSQSTNERVARGFADGGGEVQPAADATVSVFVEVEVVDARDLGDIGIYGAGEGEWLLPPGGKLVVQSIGDDTVRNEGLPPAKAWKKVRMKQVRA